MWTAVKKYEQERFLTQSSENIETARTLADKPERLTTQNSVQSLVFKIDRNKSLRNFVPFVLERDSMNRLIGGTLFERDRIRSRSIDTHKATDRKSSKEPDRDFVPVSKKDVHHLRNILDLEISSNGERSHTENYNGAEPTAETLEDCDTGPVNYSQFRMIQKMSDNSIETFKKSILNNRIKEARDLSSDKCLSRKPSSAFLTVTRDSVQNRRAQSLPRGSEITYETSGIVDMLKPKTSNPFISTVKFERNKVPTRTHDNFLVADLNIAPKTKHIIDFSRQISRELRDKILSNEIGQVKPAPKQKDIRDMDRDYQFGKYLREKYTMTKPKIPRSWKIKKSMIPLTNAKYAEMKNTYFNNYNVVLDRTLGNE